MNRRSRFVTAAMIGGFLFLYLPIVLLVVFSFNESRLVTVWGGFSTKWYGELFRNQQILGAAWLSFKIAAMHATGATVLGTLAGLALARFGRFRGRPLLTGLATAPLVMPEVITGLSLLLLFVAMEQLIGWPEGRGITTITIAHMTFSMAYVTVVVQSRLATLDESLEEAAMDLGARPAKVFFLITLPIIVPAILAGWLLAFTLSWDDLVITSFVTGPGSSTLPIVIFSKVRLGVSPDINALATIIVLLVAAVRPLEDGRPNQKALPQEPKVERIEVDKTSRDVRALDKDGKLLAYYPASIGSAEKPAPSGETKVTRVAFDPTYTYNPKYAFKGVKAREKFTIKPGPNNPVGAVWIDLAIESYGIHGTPEPEKVGKTESHGCIRLTNWSVRELGRHVAKGAKVAFKDG